MNYEERLLELVKERDQAAQEAVDLRDEVARLRQLEAVLVHCNTRGLVPPLSTDHQSNVMSEYRRTVQADAVLRAVRVLKNTTYAPPPGTNTFWAGVDHSITEMVNYSEAIRRGEVEI